MGTGGDQRAAVMDGLVQAVQEINGVRIQSHSVNHESYVNAIEDLKRSVTDSSSVKADIQTTSGGLISSFDVLDQKQNPDSKLFEVHLRVRVWVRDRPISARKIIAVLPYESARGSYSVFGHDVAAKDLQQLLSQRQVEHLVQSHKFTVLDRDFLTQILGEQKLIDILKLPLIEQLKIGQELGADYLVVGRIENLDAAVEAGTVDGRNVTRRHARLSIAYRVVDVTTSKDHLASTFTQLYSDYDLNHLAPERAAMRPEQLFMRDAGDAIADVLISGLYPIRVIDIKGSSIILDQGGVRTTVDEELDLYNEGKKLINPDTHEVLGTADEFLGIIRVTQVAKVTYAALVSVDSNKIVLGQTFCRRHVDPAAKYLRHPEANPGPGITAVVVVGADNEFDEMGDVITERLVGNGVHAASDFFTAGFVADEMFDRIFDGSWKEGAALGLSGRCRYIVLARRRDKLVEHKDLQKMIAGSGSLDVRVIRTNDGECVSQFKVSADTAEFSREKAIGRLTENLTRQVDKHGLGDWVIAAKSAKASGKD